MVAHPSAGHGSGSLVNALLFHCKDLSTINGSLRPGIVHRLDMDTSGAIISAKNDAAHRSLADQFANRTVKKEYLAICRRQPAMGYFLSATAASAGTPRAEPNRPCSRAATKAAMPTLIFKFWNASKAICFSFEPCHERERTHQIRVHLAKSGFPILADGLYGKEAALPELCLTRHALHAARLSVDHPTNGKRETFEAPLAKDMAAALEILRSG